MMSTKEIKKMVYSYPTKSEYGFMSDEQEKLLKQFPEINMDKYNDALMGVTCMRDEESGDLIIYHCDVLTAIICGIENRNITQAEWD